MVPTALRRVCRCVARVVPKAYSGTGPLKTDFTRYVLFICICQGYVFHNQISTDKRSKAGAIQDKINSIMRYYGNDFTDGPRQVIECTRSQLQNASPDIVKDAYDLVTGAWRPRQDDEIELWADKRDFVTRYVCSVHNPRKFHSQRFAGSVCTFVRTPRQRFGYSPTSSRST